MVIKNILILVCSMSLFSCNCSNSQNSNSVDISINTWILDNQELKSILSDYINNLDDELSGRENSFIQISYKIINDSTYSYNLSESIDINTFIHFPPQIIFQFENRLICCHIFGLDIFRINDDFLVEVMKKHYPRQYDYYLRVGDYPPPITGGGLEWKLTFQNGHLINKDVYHSQ